MNLVKEVARQVLIRACPMSTYWRLWEIRYGRTPLRQEGLRREEDKSVDALLARSEKNYQSLSDALPGSHWPEWFRHNPSFESPDSDSYFAVIRRFRPKKIIEVGVGYSSHVALNATMAAESPASITLIDPDPRCPTPRGVTLVRELVQDIPLSLFTSLNANDILFIDSSHTAEEARYHCTEILPRLNRGVIIHHHDIMYPYKQRHHEEDVVLNFYKSSGGEFEILFGLAKLWHDGIVARYLSAERLAQSRIPSSLWVRKR